MVNKIRKFVRKIQIWNNNRKIKFDLVLNNKFPTIKIGERHEKTVKTIIRFLTVTGILLSVVSFSEWYIALFVALSLFIVGQFFERIIFTYSVMLVQPFPEKWDGSKWSMMVVGYFENSYVLAFGFDTKIVADDFFDTLLNWNYGNKVNEGNICISLVLEDKKNYSVHVYPSIEREFVKDSIKKIESDNLLEKYGKEQQNLVTQFSFCKVFPNGKQSAYNLLKNNNKNILICTYDTSKFDVTKPGTIHTVKPYDNRRILCKEIKVKTRRNLNSKSEYIEFYNVPII